MMIFVGTDVVYVKRTYRLIDLKAPIGLLPNGIRAYFVAQMVGRDIEGSIRRAFNSDYGQHLILTLTGIPAILDEIVVVTLYDNRWNTELIDEQLRTQRATARTFNIIGSSRGATCGRRSDPS